MNEVSFPGIVSATAAAAIFGANFGPYLTDTRYYVSQPGPTSGQLADLTFEPSVNTLASDLAAAYASLAEGQESLGSEFEAVWDANIDKLYEF